MRISEWFGSRRVRIYQTRPYRPTHPHEQGVFDRQERIPGFDQAALLKAAVVFIGAGGLNSWPALAAVQAGLQKIMVVDRDVVEAANCNRQFFTPRQVGRPKVFALAENLAAFGAGESTMTAYPHHFEDMVALSGADVFSDATVAVVGIDSEESRVAASQHFRRLRIPAILSGVSVDGKTGSIMIQAPEGPCYGCCFPQVVKALGSRQAGAQPCAPTPAMSPILHAVGGLILEALFSVLMPKLHHEWNFWYLCADGSLPSGGSLRKRLTDCPLCGEGAANGDSR
jgi:molybdopterin/thiamine biosynthesis adenylyltransferase